MKTVLLPRRPVSAKNAPTEIRLVLPFPPSANRYWRSKAIQSKGRAFVQTYVSTEAKQYKAAVRRVASLVCGAMFTDDVSIDVKLFRPRKSGDVDNRTKVLFDALNGVVYKDDKQVVKYAVERFEDKNNPRVEVTIKKYFQEME